MARSKQPAMMFYVGDWLKDPAVRGLTLAARGFWFDILCYIHSSGVGGTLTGDAEFFSRLVGCSRAETIAAVEELKSAGTANVSYHGDAITIVNRRMKRDATIAKKRSKAGKKGMKQRWNNKSDNKPITKPPPRITEVENEIETREETGGKECEGRGKKKPRIEFDSANITWLNVTAKDVAGWRATFAAVDIDYELKSAAQWARDNPAKRKKNWRRFLTNWFRRRQERGGTPRPKKGERDERTATYRRDIEELPDSNWVR